MHNILIAILFIIGFAVRLLFLADLPKGLMQDEAFSIWQAWALLEHGFNFLLLYTILGCCSTRGFASNDLL